MLMLVNVAMSSFIFYWPKITYGYDDFIIIEGYMTSGDKFYYAILIFDHQRIDTDHFFNLE